MSRIVKIGFTGTREGLTDRQRATLAELMPSRVEFHHGDCVGADAAAHVLAQAFRCYIVVHPPTEDRFRAFCNGDEEREPKPYLVRNKDIVKETSRLIACPKELTEQRIGGTWSTVRYARSFNRSITFIFPDGSVKEE